jgi:glucose-1-phosphate adenylyltransferase
MTPNKLEPDKLDTGITMVGKRSRLPDGLTVGRNCKLGADLCEEDFASATLGSGETVENHTFAHGWERELAEHEARYQPGR